MIPRTIARYAGSDSRSGGRDVAHKILKLKKDTFPYTHDRGKTPPLEKSIEDIKKLLIRFKAGQFSVNERHDKDLILITLVFERLGKVYLLEFPVTYLNDKLDMRVSGRIMFHHLKALLVAVETTYLDFSQAMMGYRALPDPEDPRRMITLQEAYERHGDRLPAAGFNLQLLPGGET